MPRGLAASRRARPPEPVPDRTTTLVPPDPARLSGQTVVPRLRLRRQRDGLSRYGTSREPALRATSRPGGTGGRPSHRNRGAIPDASCRGIGLSPGCWRKPIKQWLRREAASTRRGASWQTPSGSWWKRRRSGAWRRSPGVPGRGAIDAGRARVPRRQALDAGPGREPRAVLRRAVRAVPSGERPGPDAVARSAGLRSSQRRGRRAASRQCRGSRPARPSPRARHSLPGLPRAPRGRIDRAACPRRRRVSPNELSGWRCEVSTDLGRRKLHRLRGRTLGASGSGGSAGAWR